MKITSNYNDNLYKKWFVNLRFTKKILRFGWIIQKPLNILAEMIFFLFYKKKSKLLNSEHKRNLPYVSSSIMKNL